MAKPKLSEAALAHAFDILADQSKTVDEALAYLDLGPDVFRGAALDGADFDDADLTGYDFSGASLAGASFKRALLDRADFSQANLRNASFQKAQMIGVRCENANFNGVRMRGAVIDVTGKAPASLLKADGYSPVRHLKLRSSMGQGASRIRVHSQAGKAVTHSVLMQTLADHLGVEKSKVTAMTEGYLDVVKAYVLKGAKVKLGDLGMIMVRPRKARMGRNPQTGEPVKIKASKKLAFAPSTAMRTRVVK